MTNYEVMFILDPALEDDKKEAAVEMVKEIIAAEGEVGNVDVWGMRKLAYPINYEADGYYVVYNFDSKPDFPVEFERVINITDGVLRSLVVLRK